MKLAIIISHPIQYYAPVFQLLASQVFLKVFYTSQVNHFDRGFNCHVDWNIPLLEGYDFTFTKGAATIPAISAFDPSHLLVYGWSPSGHVKILRHFKSKAQILFRGDSTLLNKEPLWKRTLKSVVLKRIYACVDTAFYVGTNNKAYFQQYGLKDHQLIFAPHAIDNTRFSQNTAAIALRNSLGVQPKDTLILFAGKMTKNKNPMLLLKAFKNIANPHNHLLFVGDGELSLKLQKQAKGNLNIHVWPFQNQKMIPMFYQACDLFCLPSKSESWGLAINEAMACGKAVVVSAQCGAAADLVNRENGRTFKSDDLNDLQQQLNYYLSNPLLLKKAGSHARRTIQDWSFEVQVKNIIQRLHHA